MSEEQMTMERACDVVLATKNAVTCTGAQHDIITKATAMVIQAAMMAEELKEQLAKAREENDSTLNDA